MTGNKMSFLTHLRAQHDKLGPPNTSHKWLPVRLKPRGTPNDTWIQVPYSPLTFSKIDSVVRRHPLTMTGTTPLHDFGFGSPEELLLERTNLLGFLLGAVVGDSSKHAKGMKRFSSRSLSLVLSTNKPNSWRFGEFTAFCANASLGLGMHRINDLPISDKRYGKSECYAWISASSPIISWIFNDCLGLKDGQTTTYDPLHMDWILDAPRDFCTHFIQGLAESDGWSDAGRDIVKVVSSPNTELFKLLLNYLECPARVAIQPPVELLTCRTEDAMKLPFFSPRIQSNLYQDMRILAHAKRHPERKRLPKSTIELIRELSKITTSDNETCLKLAKAIDYKVSADTVRKYSKQ